MRKIGDPQRYCDLVEELRDEELDSVTLIYDNPESFGNDQTTAVECYGFWTGLNQERFYGRNVIDALEKAVLMRRARASGTEKIPPTNHIDETPEAVFEVAQGMAKRDANPLRPYSKKSFDYVRYWFRHALVHALTAATIARAKR